MDEQSFEKIVNKTKQVVLAAARQHLLPTLRDHIDDIVQETYIKTYKKLTKCPLEEIKSLENYLYTIAKNEAFRKNQKEKKYVQLSNELENLIPEKTKDSSALEEVKHMMSSLPVQYQTVIKLFYEGFSLTEIASQMNQKSGAVKTQLFRARKMLINNMKLGGMK